MAEPATHRRFTWDAYRSWSDEQRWAIVGDEAFAMSPSPTYRHQRIIIQLLVQVQRYFSGKTYQTVVSPMDSFWRFVHVMMNREPRMDANERY